MDGRQVRLSMFEQLAVIGKALASPKRLELLDLLCQAEKSVEALAQQAGIDVKLTSSHLKDLKAARLIDSRREGRNVFYRVADPAVAGLLVNVRKLAVRQLAELQTIVRDFFQHPEHVMPMSRDELLARAESGEVIVIDVRPRDEYDAGHLPFARSVPMAELRQHLARLPKKKTIVAYCRGPFCLFATQAVDLLNETGFEAYRLEDGVAEWSVAGFPVIGSARREQTTSH